MVRLVREEQKSLERKATESSAAYVRYLRGRSALRDRTESGMRDAKKLFEEAIAEELSAPSSVPADLPLLCSPDMMIERRPDGSARLILGEVHDTLMLWGWALNFAAEPGELAAQMRAFASGLGLEKTANLLTSKRKKIVPFEYPGLTVAFQATTDGSNETIPIAALDVVPNGTGLDLVVRATGEILKLHNGELPSLAHAIFALPRCVPFDLDLGAQTPRLTAHGVVLQRRRWRLDRAGAGLPPAYQGTSYQMFCDMRRLRRNKSLPERVFVKLTGEPKPIFLDFRSYLLLEAFEGLFGQGKDAVVTEMLPDGDELWLTDHEGRQVTAELRTGFGRAAAEQISARSSSHESHESSSTGMPPAEGVPATFSGTNLNQPRPSNAQGVLP